jgi:hypothetical protein
MPPHLGWRARRRCGPGRSRGGPARTRLPAAPPRGWWRWPSAAPFAHAGAGSLGRGGPTAASSGSRWRDGCPSRGRRPARCRARRRWRTPVDGSDTAGHPASRRRVLAPRLGRQGQGCVAALRKWGMRPGVATSRGQDSLGEPADPADGSWRLATTASDAPASKWRGRRCAPPPTVLAETRRSPIVRVGR